MGQGLLGTGTCVVWLGEAAREGQGPLRCPMSGFESLVNGLHATLYTAQPLDSDSESNSVIQAD